MDDEPAIPPPSYTDATALKTAFRHLDRGGRQFPEKFSISPNTIGSSTKWVLGKVQHQPLYAIGRREQPSGNKPDLVLHDGTSLNSPTFASFRSLPGSPRTWKVRLPPSDAESEAGFELVSWGSDWRAQKRPILMFSVETDVCGQREEFEWRSSNNDNIRALLGGQSLGWKLVRITQDSFSDQLPGPRGTWPRTSKGAEIVAVFSSCGPDSGVDWRFAFLGTGVKDVLGSKWQTMSVITSLVLMDMNLRMNSEAA
ncbi:hypothetical protein SCUP234_07540 [Seiridium cupressi]